MKKEIKRNIIIKNANQISKTAFKKSKNLSLTALKKEVMSGLFICPSF